MKQDLRTVCDGMLDIFGAYGAEYIFSSPGSEWSPLWDALTGRFVGSEIEPTPDYAAIPQAFGGYGERVEEPADLPGAIRRAMERVEGGQLALLDVIVGDTAKP